mmetsp:Transcript_6139/g.18354  ORF Transcript_6139/g.18354 Transcript_6139/m.18354 type:complete len:230 (+) Transcript_6139:1180-1869(+)
MTPVRAFAAGAPSALSSTTRALWIGSWQESTKAAAMAGPRASASAAAAVGQTKTSTCMAPSADAATTWSPTQQTSKHVTWLAGPASFAWTRGLSSAAASTRCQSRRAEPAPADSSHSAPGPPAVASWHTLAFPALKVLRVTPSRTPISRISGEALQPAKTAARWGCNAASATTAASLPPTTARKASATGPTSSPAYGSQTCTRPLVQPSARRWLPGPQHAAEYVSAGSR